MSASCCAAALAVTCGGSAIGTSWRWSQATGYERVVDDRSAVGHPRESLPFSGFQYDSPSISITCAWCIVGPSHSTGSVLFSIAGRSSLTHTNVSRNHLRYATLDMLSHKELVLPHEKEAPHANSLSEIGRDNMPLSRLTRTGK